MSNLMAAVERLGAAGVESPESAKLRPLVQAVCDLRALTLPTEWSQAVAALSAALDPARVEASGWLATTAGFFVEKGAEATPLAERLIQALPHVLEPAARFGALASAEALSPEQSEEVEDESGGTWLGDRFLAAEQAVRVSEQEPEGAKAWEALGFWCRPAVASLMRDVAARRRAAASWPSLDELGQIHGDAHCLEVLLAVPEDEPFLVLHPSAGRGYRLRVSGVADNFQLHTLLADALIAPKGNRFLSWLRPSQGLPGARPDPRAVAVARGDGPQQVGSPSHGVWDLYQWTAVQPDGRLPSPVPSEHWIWGEGRPSDIKPFEGVRVVLLGPPSYVRSWNTARFFDALPARVVLEETLSAAAAREWLQRLGQAVSPQ